MFNYIRVYDNGFDLSRKTPNPNCIPHTFLLNRKVLERLKWGNNEQVGKVFYICKKNGKNIDEFNQTNVSNRVLSMNFLLLKS